MPTSHQASAQPFTSSRTTSGRASVVKSRSGPRRPSSSVAHRAADQRQAVARRGEASRASSSSSGVTRDQPGREPSPRGGQVERRGGCRDVGHGREGYGGTPPPGPPAGSRDRSRRPGYDRQMARSPSSRRSRRAGDRPARAAQGRGDLGGRAGRRPHRRHAAGGADRPGRPARPAALVAAQGPPRGRRDRRGRRRPRGRGGDRHPRPGAGRARAPSTTGSSPTTGGSTRPCTTTCSRPPAASSATRTSRSTRWPGCRSDELARAPGVRR